MGKEEGERLSIDFGESPNVLRDEYMDVYEEVFAEVVTTNTFDENVDLSTTYLGKIGMRREDVMKAEESFPISEQGFVMGRTLNGEECQILLDTGASKSYMSKLYYLRCKALHLVEAWYSLEQYIGLKEDKLSSTTVDFIRSEGNLETKHLYWFSKPKMC